jgi:hypothetical protein
MERVLVGVQGNSTRSPSSTLLPSLHEYPGCMPDRAVMSACPRRPLRARPWRLKRRARSAELWPQLWALNGPVPYQVRTTLERPEHEARKTLTLEGCDYRPVASKPAQRKRAPQVPSIYENY